MLEKGSLKLCHTQLYQANIGESIEGRLEIQRQLFSYLSKYLCIRVFTYSTFVLSLNYSPSKQPVICLGLIRLQLYKDEFVSSRNLKTVEALFTNI